MASKVLLNIALAVVFVAVATAVPRFNNRGLYATQYSRLMQAACSVTNTTSGDVLLDTDCNCEDNQISSCDVGPITYFDLEVYFCNVLDNQTEDDLYILEFACVSGEDQYCGVGTFCDIGPVTYNDVEYYLCRFDTSPTTDDTSYMCQPDASVATYPMWGTGAVQQFARSGARWVASGSNVPAASSVTPNQGSPVNGGVPAMPVPGSQMSRTTGGMKATSNRRVSQTSSRGGQTSSRGGQTSSRGGQTSSRGGQTSSRRGGRS